MGEIFYNFGPTALGLVAALAITFYCWNRFRQASIAVLIWIIFAIVVSQFPIFSQNQDSNQMDFLGFVIFGTLAFTPAAVLLYLAYRVESVNEKLKNISVSALVLTQAYRVGGIFLILAYLQGDLSAEIGLVSGVLDVTIGITAVILAIYLKDDQYKAPRLVIAWAIVSLVDFSWATVMKFASFFGVIELDPAPIMLGNPPLLIISLFALPFGIFISVYLIVRLRAEIAKK